jgi:acyl-CoA thioester hydrolase
VYYSYFDTAVNTFLISDGGLDIHRGQAIGLVVESSCRYMKPLCFPSDVLAGVRIAKIGNSSVRYEIGLFDQPDSTPAATGHFVHVFVDRDSRKPTAIPSSMRSALEAL